MASIFQFNALRHKIYNDIFMPCILSRLSEKLLPQQTSELIFHTFVCLFMSFVLRKRKVNVHFLFLSMANLLFHGVFISYYRNGYRTNLKVTSTRRAKFNRISVMKLWDKEDNLKIKLCHILMKLFTVPAGTTYQLLWILDL